MIAPGAPRVAGSADEYSGRPETDERAAQWAALSTDTRCELTLDFSHPQIFLVPTARFILQFYFVAEHLDLRRLKAAVRT